MIGRAGLRAGEMPAMESKSESLNTLETRAFASPAHGIALVCRAGGRSTVQYWPAADLIHHNPLHGMEDMPFPRPSNAEHLLGGKGYLSNAIYRRVSSSKAASA